MRPTFAEYLEQRFLDKGFKLQQFNGKEGTGWYCLKLDKYKNCNDWKFVSGSLLGVADSIVLNEVN